MEPTKQASLSSASDWFAIRDVQVKLEQLPRVVGEGLGLTVPVKDFELGRDVGVVPPSQLPPKPGLFKTEGQARLLHDLASIELQATELAVRTLVEFPDAPKDFRNELAELAVSEGRHLQLCLDGMNDLGFPWGSWDVHLTLWNAVSPEDSLLDRILIVHRYLEGSGLDAGESILRRMQGVKALRARPVVETIVREEVDHVHFGSRWYRRTAEALRLDPDKDFEHRIAKVAREVPRRERLAHDLRRRAGFTETELSILERFSENPNRCTNV
ncbi:MAG TPA: DUF455 family protein [Bdellovibrionales bacterium]|nr:DUF455 family protein [Bdellovibrionales bacterium]